MFMPNFPVQMEVSTERREATEFFSRKKLVIQIHIQEQILSQTDLDVPFMRMRTDSGKPLILEEVGTKRTSNPRGLQAGHGMIWLS